MPNIRVKLFANFREFAGTKELELEGNTVHGILEILCERFPGMEKMIFKSGKVHPYINIFLNGKDIKDMPGQGGTTLHRDDEIAIFPPVSGG